MTWSWSMLTSVCLKRQDELPIVRSRIMSLFPLSSRQLEVAFAEISETIGYARAFGVTRPIFVRPAMSRRAAVS